MACLVKGLLTAQGLGSNMGLDSGFLSKKPLCMTLNPALLYRMKSA